MYMLFVCACVRACVRVCMCAWCYNLLYLVNNVSNAKYTIGQAYVQSWYEILHAANVYLCTCTSTFSVVLSLECLCTIRCASWAHCQKWLTMLRIGSSSHVSLTTLVYTSHVGKNSLTWIKPRSFVLKWATLVLSDHPMCFLVSNIHCSLYMYYS